MIASVKPHVGDAGAVAHKQDAADTQTGNKPYSPHREKGGKARQWPHASPVQSVRLVAGVVAPPEQEKRKRGESRG